METNAKPDLMPSSGKKARGNLLVYVLVIASTLVLSSNLIVSLLYKRPGPPPIIPEPEAPPEPSFVGSSDNLQKTIVVPALEAEVPAGKSAIWCATLPLAWQTLEKEIIKEPIKLAGADQLASWLSNSPDPQLDPQHYYTAAGLFKHGILGRIERELYAKFPKAPPLPPIPVPSRPKEFLAFAYLELDIHFYFNFNHDTEPLLFKDSQGQETKVHAFGIREKDKGRGIYGNRGQVDVLFRDKDQFAVDLCRHTGPYQVILARMERQTALKATLDDLERKIKAFSTEGVKLSPEAVLLVPSIHWELERRFKELEDRPILNYATKDYPFELVLQWIHFKMDRKGTSLASYTLAAGALEEHDPNDFRFDKPYLIVLRKRDAKHPFFVMWVDNAELLQRR